MIKIIGTESQTIHVILKRNEKININKNYILYASSEELDEIIYKFTIKPSDENSSNGGGIGFRRRSRHPGRCEGQRLGYRPGVGAELQQE